jgi:hypothetical protein
MSAIIRFVAPGQLSFLPAGKSSLFEHLEPKPTRLSLIREPEPPLWKLARRAVSPKIRAHRIIYSCCLPDSRSRYDSQLPG